MDTETLAKIDNNSLIVTVNQRLSSYIRQQYDQLQQTNGILAWSSIQVLPLSSWLQSCWQQLMDIGAISPKLLLSDQEEAILWQHIIRQAKSGSPIQTSATAKLAKQAWQISQQWCINKQKLAAYDAIEIQTFLAWSHAFEDYCQLHNLLSASQLFIIIQTAIQQKALPLPKTIYLAGFDEISPAFEQFIDVLQENNCTVTTCTNKHPDNQKIAKLAFHNSNDEINNMARWAASLYVKHGDQIRIACVLPNLANMRDQVERIFTQVFAPDHYLQPQLLLQLPFNISGGKPLAQHAIIRDTLLLLKLTYSSLSRQEFSTLLRSPYWVNDKAELAQRHLLDKQLHKLNINTFTLSWLGELNQHFDHHCPILMQQIQALQGCSTQYDTLSFAQWAICFKQCLDQTQWLQKHELSLKEQQLLLAWQTLQQQFIRLDNLLPSINQQQAYLYLTLLAAHSVFQTRTEHVTPIQVLGTLEASGQLFDYLWIAGLHDRDWPAPAKSNPFIPLNLQRELSIPHSSAQRELHFSQLLTQRLCQSAKHILISYPMQVDSQPAQPSPLITEIKDMPVQQLTLADDININKLMLASSKLEYYQDWQAPRYQSDETLASGGSFIFQEQANCPFRAYAHLRLQAESLEEFEIGLNARQRGNLVHNTLEYVWQKLQSQRQLLTIADKDLQTIINAGANHALTRLNKNNLLSLGKQHKQLEKQRLVHLLNRWLAHEKQRPDFVVKSIEQKHNVSIEDLNINLKADRIDQLDDGSFIIIDYKTGIQNIMDWFDERIGQPQLPLYAITSQIKINGIAFAQLHAKEMLYKGVSNDDYQIPGIKNLTDLKNIEFSSWNQLIAYWQQSLQELANEFTQGHAIANPKDKATCSICDLHALCRINELELNQ